jgi:hypothetical protein
VREMQDSEASEREGCANNYGNRSAKNSQHLIVTIRPLLLFVYRLRGKMFVESLPRN